MSDENFDIFIKYNPCQLIPIKKFFHTQGDAGDIMRYGLTTVARLFPCERAV